MTADRVDGLWFIPPSLQDVAFQSSVTYSAPGGDDSIYAQAMDFFRQHVNNYEDQSEDMSKFIWNVLAQLSGEQLDTDPDFTNLPEDKQVHLSAVLFVAFVLGMTYGRNEHIRLDAIATPQA